ncbi:putative oligopeptidase family protein [Phaeomoniella chlamydospora]|uniref:Dipeptidyl-peptidase V n=1 Tax=Phaeomoniella chlamydospora TaxID=158046 RepID=A0A0G2GEL9_PHACM|nr:putative oligopeptidase family protein [Phaeomoniella chlamydospora]
MPFNARTLLSAPRRSAAAPSADGTLALYIQSTYSFETSVKTVEIQVLEIATGKVTVLSSDPKASEPKWLGTGHEVVWLKAGDNGNTTFVVTDADELGKTYAAGTVAGGISNLKLCTLEDDKVAIAVSGLANPDGTLYNPKDAPTSRTTAKIYDSLFVRHWDSYVEAQKNVIWTGVLQKASSKVTERKGRFSLIGLVNVLKDTSLESPIPPFGGSDNFDISPKGVVFVSKDSELDPATHTKCNTYYVPVSSFLETFSATPKQLSVSFLKGAATSPVFSPDGESIAFLQMTEDGYESDKNHIVVFPKVAAEGKGYTLFTDDERGSWDRSPSAIMWSNDGKNIYAQAEDIGRGCLFKIPLNGSLTASLVDSPSKLTDSGTVVDIAPASATSSKLFISSSSLVDNSTFVILDPDSKTDAVQKVSSLTHDGSFFGLSRKQVSELWWKGSDDQPIHAWMMKPSNFSSEKRYPLAYLIHGGPQGAWLDSWGTRWNPAVFAEQGYVVICPNPTGSTSYGKKFTDDIQNSWGGKPYEDLVKGIEYIESSLAFVDKDRMIAAGASYGGYMVNWIQGHELGRRFKALVCHDGVFSMTGQLASEEQYFPLHDLKGPIWEVPENYAQWDPSRFCGNWSTPQLVIHNELDYRLTIAEGLSAFNVLQMRGVESRFLTFPDENHWVLKQENSLVWHRVVLDWINRFVGLPQSSFISATRVSGTTKGADGVESSEDDDGLPRKLGWKAQVRRAGGLRKKVEGLSL